jgi:sarcosine oxidase subunit delta
MLISCPFCGPRQSGEFSYLGDAAQKRPYLAVDEMGVVDETRPQVEEAFHDYVYLRDNLAGEMEEYWYHGGGCRAWLVAARNTLTHAFTSVRAAPGVGAGNPRKAGAQP